MWGQAVSKRATLRWANGADGWARSVIRTVRARAEGERGAGLRTGLPQRDEVGRRPGREERGNWARVGFGLSFQGCLGFGPGCKSLGWAHMFELGLS